MLKEPYDASPTRSARGWQTRESGYMYIFCFSTYTLILKKGDYEYQDLGWWMDVLTRVYHVALQEALNLQK